MHEASEATPSKDFPPEGGGYTRMRKQENLRTKGT